MSIYTQQLFNCNDINSVPVDVALEFIDPSGNTTNDTVRVFVLDTLTEARAIARDTVYVSNTLNGPIAIRCYRY